MRLPRAQPSLQDGWREMPDVVRWIAYRGGEIPKYGSADLDGEAWVCFGDRDVVDLEKIRAARDDLRLRLTAGDIDSVGRRVGTDAPELIHAGLWAEKLGLVISDWDYRPDCFEAVLLPWKRVEELWPRTSQTSCREWISSHDGSNVKTAWSLYHHLPGGVKKQVFEEEWRNQKGRGRGRPPKKK